MYTPVLNAARWIARHELWLLAAAAAIILFAARWAWAGLALIGLCWLCRRVATGRPTLPTPLDPPIAAIVVMALVGLAASPAAAISRPALARLALGVALYYGIANTMTTARALRRFTGLVITGGVALALLGAVGANWSAESVRLLSLPIYARLPQLPLDLGDNSTINPRVLGLTLAMLIPAALASVMFGRTARGRLLAAAACLPMLGVLILAQSVQGVLGLAAALFFLLVVWSPWAALLLLPAAAAAAWGASRLDLPGLAQAALDIGNPAGIAVVLRLDIWGRALDMIRDLPFTGIGLDAFPLVQTHFYIGHLLGPEPHAHSLYLQAALDLGLPGLAAFLWLLAAWGVSLGRAYRRTRERDLRRLLVGPAAGIAATLASGTIDTLWTAKPGVLMWVLLGMGTAAASLIPVAEGAARETAARCRRRLAWSAAAAGLILSGALAWIVPNANLALVRAQRVILAAREAGPAPAAALEAAAAGLRRAAERVPGDADVQRRLGSALAWLGEDLEALAALRRAVALDMADLLGRHAAFVAWRRQLTGGPPGSPAADALLVYGQWLARFPARAENAATVALVWAEHAGDAGRAAGILRSALERGAQPAGILEYALRTIAQ